MRQLGVLLAALAAAGALAAASTGAAAPVDQAMTLNEVAGSDFPEQAFILSLPEQRKLTTENVHVLENGEPVNDLTVGLPGSDETRVGVVLLIDTSKSMEGEPIEKAMEAARTFATRLPARTELAVIPFNNKTPLALPFTNDPKQVAETLSEIPPLAFNTHMYDAVVAANDLLDDEQIDVGTIVLLSDGADVGSTASREDAIEAALRTDARLFAVGLRSPQFDAAALEQFASVTGGSYAEAQTTDDLAPILQRIGQRISSEYLLRYESFAGAGSKVYVAVTVDGIDGTATTSYTAPGISAGTFVDDTTWIDRLIQSPITALLVGIAIVALVGFGVFTLVRLLDRRLEKRMAHFVTMTDTERSQLRREEVDTTLEDDEAEAEKRLSLRGLRWYRQLEHDVEIGRIRYSAGTIVLASTLLAFLAGAFAVWFTGSGWAAFFAIVPPIVVHSLVKRRVSTTKRLFGEQLPETLDVVSSALRAGHSLVGALGVAVEGAPEPSHTELGRALADERLGVPLDQALRVVAHRMESTDLTQVSLVAQLQREAGTNVAEVLDQVATNIRNRLELQRLIRTLTAQGRMSRWIVSLLPVGLFAIIYSVNPDYLSPLWETSGGVAAMIVAGFMIVLGSYVIKRIVEIDA